MVKRKILFIIYILILFFSFLSLEVFIRLNPNLYSQGYRPSKNPKLIYELYPGYEIKSLKAKISLQGLNDRIFPMKKPPGIFRIAVVGDSTSFGWKIRAQSSFPKVLERMLNFKKNVKFEVINFSVPGYNTAQEYEILKEKVLKFNPDMVILVFCPNDVHMSLFLRSRITFWNYLYNKSYLIHFIIWKIDAKITSNHLFEKEWLWFKKNILKLYYYEQPIYPQPGLEATKIVGNDPPRSKKEVPNEYWYMLGYENYRAHLSNIYSLLNSQNIKFVSSGFFTREALKINKELKIKNICNFFGIFVGLPAEKYTLPNEGHLNEWGHRMVAKYLYDFLKKNFNL